MEKILKVGIIGAGVQGQLHIECFKSLYNAEVVSVSDISEEKLKIVREKYGIESVYTDYKRMLKEEKIDAVSIVLPDHLHREPAISAIEEGKHILIEKPLATTVKDAEEIVRRAEEKGIKLMVNFSNRWMVYMAETKKAIENGELGEPVYAYARLSNTLYVPTKMLSWASKTSLPFWLMSHTIDTVSYTHLRAHETRHDLVCRLLL